MPLSPAHLILNGLFQLVHRATHPSVFVAICPGLVQRTPRRMPSPNRAKRTAMGQKIRKEMMIVILGSRPARLEKKGDPRNIDSPGVSSIFTASPQSKATAIPIPLGAVCLSVSVSMDEG